MGNPSDRTQQGQTGSTPNHSITVVDNRTGKSYLIPIKNNSIPATAFKGIKASPHSVFGEPDRSEDETIGGLRVYDPAYMNTAVVRSTITYINGEEGVLRYRGYPIQDLAKRSNFLEVAYLLLYGDLPTSAQFQLWQDEVMHHTFIHSDVEGLFKSFRYDSHPMSMLTAAFAALGAFSSEANPSLAGQSLYTRGATGDSESLKVLDKQILRLIGKAPTLAAAAYRVRQGRPFNRPAKGLSYTANFLYLLDNLNEKDYQPHPVFEKALDTLFILHADHEMNCSTATMMQVGSSLVDPYSAISAACAALYGPAHGGASESAIRMLMEIGRPENVPSFIEKVKSKQRVLSGFGHRVYRNFDPRSIAIRELAEEVFKVTGRNQLLDTALHLAETALKDEYFISRRLYPNIDFYSGLVYQAMGFSLDFYPVLFAVPRCVGWLAHWRQMILTSPDQGGVKIWRPRQIYVGESEREYQEIQQRSDQQTWKDDQEEFKKRPVQVPHGGDSKRNAMATYRDERGRLYHASKL
ncbi:citrate synthase family member [Violaceomyces palustris]|uniref:Citrate synthase family member n=1 Tax=Violaceomyces palustris TaxID=1673888 RepID=A0ACD0P5B5_9BASI|nr:citrate synthase family member [Violaceomyces palustris]